jgi:hypothetical protein
MPQFWRVTTVYGLSLIVMDVVAIFLGDISARFGASAMFLGFLAVSVLVPAFLAGGSFGRLMGREAARTEAWRFALWFAFIQSLLLGLLFALLMQELLIEEPDGLTIFAVLLSACAGFSLLVSRYFFGAGALRHGRLRPPR